MSTFQGEEMRRMTWIFILLMPCILLLLPGSGIHALTYDYSATIECLVEPKNVQYNGGIIKNPEFNNGTQGWTTYGQAQIQQRSTQEGNHFIAAFNRKQPSGSPSQRIQLENGMLYAFSAWIQISQGTGMVAVIFRGVSAQVLHGGTVMAEEGCWSMLKGGIISNFSGPADLTFEYKNTTTEIWVDNVSVQPFTMQQWRSHQDSNIEMVRKSRVKFHITHANNTAMRGAKITLKQTKPAYPVGCEINHNILNNTAYQHWIASRFTVTAFGNEMKWYSTEEKRGHENYTVPDAMLKFAEQNNISVRGHNILWDDPRYQPNWVNFLSPTELKEAISKHIKSVVSRYKGRLIHWDVVNENVHFRFYEDKLGENASAAVFAMVKKIDQKPLLFMNEYNTIEYSEDEVAAPSKYVNKLKNILAYQGNSGLCVGIGLQSRFGPGQPNLAYMRAAMDILASTGFPLWLTEVFVDKGENQTEYLEEVLREGYSHPAVEGIVIWPTSPFTSNCNMCLTDMDFKNTPNGDVVDKLIEEWRSETKTISTNNEGFSKIALFHGDHQVTVKKPGIKSSTSFNLKVTKDIAEKIVHVMFDDAFVPHACM